MTIPSGFGQINLKFTGASIPTGAETTWGFENVGNLSLVAVYNAVVADITANNWLAPLSNTIDVASILIKLGPDATGPSAEFASSLGGGTAGNVSPPNVAVLVHKHTAVGGRRGRGRMYLPGVIETVVGDDGTLDNTFRTGIETDLNDFLAALDASSIPMHVLHGDSSTPNEVQSLGVSLKAATQRRRLRR